MALSFLVHQHQVLYIYTQPIMVIIFAYLFAYIGFSDDYTDSITIQKMFYMLLIFIGVYLTGKEG